MGEGGKKSSLVRGTKLEADAACREAAVTSCQCFEIQVANTSKYDVQSIFLHPSNKYHFRKKRFTSYHYVTSW